MKRLLLTLAVLTWLCPAALAAADEGVVAYYPFGEGSGAVAHDRSGNGNDGKIMGGAKWVKGDFGSALEFDGTDDYVDCGVREALDIGSGGTVMVWAHPDPAQGGLVTWTEEGTGRARLGIMVDTYHGGRRTGFGTLPKTEWTHLAYTFDGKTISRYRDGLLRSSRPQARQPNLTDVNLWIGRGARYGLSFFKGVLDEVRIYQRPLSGQQILVHYKEEGPARGKDMTLFRRVDLTALPYRGPGKIVVRLDVQAMQPLAEGTAIQVKLQRPGSAKPIQQLQTRDIPKHDSSDVTFDVGDLPAGQYLVSAHVIGPEGAAIGEESSVPVEWEGRLEEFKDIKILNNFCWELVNVSPAGESKYVFSLPYDRWVFVRSVASVGIDGLGWLGIDSAARDDAAIVHYFSRVGRNKEYDNQALAPEREPDETTRETMRYLRAGEHVVHLGRSGKAEFRQLVVRAIPGLYYNFYGGGPYIEPFGPYDWDFIRKHLPDANVMVAGMEYYFRADAYARLEEWKRLGRQWITSRWTPNWIGFKAPISTVEQYYDYWAYSAGLQHPLLDGIFLDEFVWGDTPNGLLSEAAIKRLYANPKFKGKQIHVACDALYGEDASTKFGRAVMKGGGFFCWERYFHEAADAKAMERMLRRYMVLPMTQWEKALPGSTRQMVMLLGESSEPPRFNNALDPGVDYKVCQDIQVHKLATDPAFFGLAGLGWWDCNHCSEETLRWIGRLSRHYAVEGNTDRLSKEYGFKYELEHIRNPDFVAGTQGWTIGPAELGSVRGMTHKGYGYYIQGRFMGIGDLPVRADLSGHGDSFLWMKRSAKKPNVFSQEIRNLKPGQLYSMKMVTADYMDLIQERSEKKAHNISINLENVELLLGPDKSFRFPLSHARAIGKFTAGYPYLFNYHWRVFRAKATTARLIVSDWESDTEPGGRIGQELMFNHTEVQPYFEK